MMTGRPLNTPMNLTPGGTSKQGRETRVPVQVIGKPLGGASFALT